MTTPIPYLTENADDLKKRLTNRINWLLNSIEKRCKEEGHKWEPRVAAPESVSRLEYMECKWCKTRSRS